MKVVWFKPTTTSWATFSAPLPRLGAREARCVATAVEGVSVGAGVFNDPGQARGYVTLVGVVGGVSARVFVFEFLCVDAPRLGVERRSVGPALHALRCNAAKRGRGQGEDRWRWGESGDLGRRGEGLRVGESGSSPFQAGFGGAIF